MNRGARIYISVCRWSSRAVRRRFGRDENLNTYPVAVCISEEGKRNAKAKLS